MKTKWRKSFFLFLIYKPVAHLIAFSFFAPVMEIRSRMMEPQPLGTDGILAVLYLRELLEAEDNSMKVKWHKFFVANTRFVFFSSFFFPRVYQVSADLSLLW